MSTSSVDNVQPYYQAVWALVRQIPTGRVATYGQIAKLLPQPPIVNTDVMSSGDYPMTAARLVGMAMAASPDDVPWQRVVNAQGKISHPANLAEHKSRLEAEGILLVGDKLNLSECQWAGPGQNDTPTQGRLF